MAVVRVVKDKNFTVMSNYHLDDKNLSNRAAGLLTRILRLPEDWDYTIAGLAELWKDGKDSIRSTIEELEAAGYIERRRLHKPNGTFAGNEYVVHERPISSPVNDEEGTIVGMPYNGETPLSASPTLAKPTEPNTNIPSTKYIPPYNPPRKRVPKKVPDHKPDRFDAFWAYYPRGESKQAAIAAWDRLKPDDELLTVMGRALKRQMSTKQWQDGIGIPYASTWLNQRRWEDESYSVHPPSYGGCWAPDPEVY